MKIPKGAIAAKRPCGLSIPNALSKLLWIFLYPQDHPKVNMRKSGLRK